MHSGMIGKIEKAHRYAEERDRFQFDAMELRVRGDNAEHTVTLANGAWSCGCAFFGGNGACAHTMAAERLLAGMVPVTEFELTAAVA